jgi:AmmeMemoRadiSam system protein B/AmmeMemoRadiSam system radical SAM enzyme/AmmeMemoRadiSam system protein A
MKTRVANESLADAMDRRTVTGAPELWHAEGDRLRCVACGHRCLVGDGLRGICKVRFNEGGQLKVPYGYVAGVQCDPVEKKPFFHVYPGSDALTFGMLGCDLHCSYCFPGDTPVMTDQGPISLERAFQTASRIQQTHDAEIAYPDGLRAVAGSGTFRPVRAVFRHTYRGRLAILRPYYLPELRCTPDHRVYATTDPAVPPQPVKAGELTAGHFLAIPRRHASSSARTVDAGKELEAHRFSYCVPWKLTVEQRQWIAEATARGQTSRQIGATLGKSGSYVRHVRRKISNGRAEDVRSGSLLVDACEVRFPNEHRPGIPRTIPLDATFARLLGLYCAEGCVTKSKKRPNSFTLNFSFSHEESGLVDEVRRLLRQCLGLRPQTVRRTTTLAVAVSKASAALLFKRLAGSGAAAKRIPPQLFDAPREVVAAFLDGYLEGDGHRYACGKVSTTTVSQELAYGVAFLALKLGFLPSIYDTSVPPEGTIQGRTVTRSPHQYTVVWYENPPSTRKAVETDQHYLIPLREVSSVEYEGNVYNMEVEEEHNYLAGLFLVCNCQNYITSQALRDPIAVAPIRPVTPAHLTDLARRQAARLVVSSYNEPLITAEWAVDVFREAKAAGLACAFVSNGNATPEVLDYLRPWIVAYKVDLKGFTERAYRSLGGTLENITRTIRMIRERGLWLEVVTLVVPGFNDSDDELRRAAAFLASVSPDVPWHVTAFHQDYKMTDPEPTGADKLVRAAEIGTAEGLRFVYAGNLPGRVGPWEDTRCPSCRATLIERFGYLVRSYRVTADGRCPSCQARVPGVWPASVADVTTGNDAAAYRGRQPRAVPLGVTARQADSATQRRVPLASLSSDLPLTHPLAGGTQAMPAAEPAPRLDLTAEQRQQIVACAAGLLRATVIGRAADAADLAELRERLVAGAFVSLKRGRHLRSCCGLVGQQVALFQALEHATFRTAREDERFPPVSPTELEHLDLEVWVLHNLRPVPARGEERLAAITVGTHGVKVVRGGASGLFLPSVAVEGNWDVLRLLDQVCVKAGLPPTAWRDDDTALYTFEGESVRARLSELGTVAPRSESRAPSSDVRVYADFCRDNLTLLLTGRVPSYFLMGAPDGNVSGVVLSLRRPDAARALSVSQLSLRHGVPLQSTLFNLTQAAAQQLASGQITPESLSAIQAGVAILTDPVLHGTVADPHLAGLDPRRRAVLVIERNKTALVYDPERTAEELLAEAAVQARVTEPGTAAVFSLDARTNAGAVSVSTVPKPVRGPAVRPPAVAGKFYDADPDELSRTVDRLLEGERRAEPWAAAMVPHAGLKYSGRIAADVLRRLRIPRTVIVLGPKHTALGRDWAVAPHQTWALPGDGVESDFMLARKLCQAIPGLEMDAAAHQGEHAVEVELPLLARLAPDARVVGVAVGHASLDDCRRIAAGLAEVLRERDEKPLLLISSDMNHFATDAETRRVDALALAALERCDPELLHATVTRHSISMCGVLPAVVVLETLRLLGGRPRAERVGYATSADVTGDTSRVVGYAGMLFGCE